MPEHLKRAATTGQPAKAAGAATTTGKSRRRGPIGRLYVFIRGLLALGMLAIVLVVLTPVPERIYTWLDVTGEPVAADYIVCLGGNPSRLLWAVEDYRAGYAPKIIVTSLPESAKWMQDKLVQCGIPRSAILVENQSRTTGDHPAAVAKLPGVDPATQRLLLVTDFEHSRRAAACFRRFGYTHISVHGAGFKLRENPEQQKCLRWRIRELPTLLYECSALVQYWVQGKI